MNLRTFFSSLRPHSITPPTLSLRKIEHERTSVNPSSFPNPVRHEAMMNDYRTEILFDLRRAVREVPVADHDRTRALYDNIGFWLREVPDAVERTQWVELFAHELALMIPGLHLDYCRAAVQHWVAESKAQA